ncbi:putative mitochondrial protein [Sesamum angolense]|uniref:Mitochondrial protein n=1 Tax=Sesamum angolense TaxID=2727404 RepID=A0AAE2BJ16_9LAMI|nr:putative mitochondrial protein [Sesamum angolense]
MNLKLDISKAYDRVEWSFLKRVLGKLGFPSAFIDLILLCISSVSYSFVLSGSQFGSISPQRGLRQGDPLSPYLFLLCTESLSALFREAADRGSVPGVAICSGAPRISHLLFADDTMVFSPADVPTVHAICQILNVYKLASGQEINLHKSSAVFSRNTPLDIQRDLAQALGLRLENKHELYLGLPAVAFRSKRALFAALKDRIWNRIQGWHEKTLSQAGKAVLIKQWCKRFRRTLCLVLSCQGRYFRSSKPWRLISFGTMGSTKNSLLSNCGDSFLARRAWCRWRIGTGHSVNIWTDPWLPRSPSFRVITPRPSHVHVVWVHDLISEDLHDWNVELIRAMFWPEDRDLILQTPLSLVGSVDLLVWHYSKNGWPLQLWHKVWQAPAPNKVKLFIWRAIRNILPTTSNLQRRIPYDNFSCPLCESVSEGPIHTFFHCAFARQVWALSNVRWHILDSSPLSMEEWITDLSAKLSSTEFAFVTMVCWTIWWTRNLKLANKEFLLPLQVIEFAHNYLTAFSAHGNSFSKGLTASMENVHKWTHPPPDSIKVNFDGGVRDGGCALGIGILARNASGHCLAWLSLRLDRSGNAEMAEALAAREAIHFALRHRWPRVIFEGDNSTLMNKISSVQADFSVISPLVADIRFLSSRIDHVSFSFVRRLGNSAADLLAECALNQGGDASCLPPGLLSVIRTDNAE